MPKPVIAMVNGVALCDGLELAMACHLRIAAATAWLGQPEINSAVIPGSGGTKRLLRLTGRAVALELCLLGMRIDAARALQPGLVHRVLEPEALQADTLAVGSASGCRRTTGPGRHSGRGGVRRPVRDRRRIAAGNSGICAAVRQRRHVRRYPPVSR